MRSASFLKNHSSNFRPSSLSPVFSRVPKTPKPSPATSSTLYVLPRLTNLTPDAAHSPEEGVSYKSTLISRLAEVERLWKAELAKNKALEATVERLEAEAALVLAALTLLP